MRSWLAHTAEQLTPREAFAAGLLAGRHADAPTAALDDWATALGKLRRDKDTGWLTPAADDVPAGSASADGAPRPGPAGRGGNDHGAAT